MSLFIYVARIQNSFSNYYFFMILNDISGESIIKGVWMNIFDVYLMYAYNVKHPMCWVCNVCSLSL